MLLLSAPGGERIDSLVVRKGASTGIDDEAIYRGWIGRGLSSGLTRGPISPLRLDGFQSTCPVEEPRPVPEPSSLLLLTLGGLTLTAASRAIGRRARRGKRRSAG